MNGGFALKLSCDRDLVLATLPSIAAREHFDLVELRDRLDADRGFSIAVVARDAETIVIPSDHGSDHAAWLECLGETLATDLGCPTSYVVDSDEGRELLRHWNGGDAMFPDTGWPIWDHAGHRRFALVPPSPVPLPDRETAALIPQLERSLAATVHAIGARITGLARRDSHGPIGRALSSWRVSLAIPDHEPVDAVVTVHPDAELAARVAWEVGRRLDGIPELATRRVQANRTLHDAVAARIGVELDSLEHEGFATVTWHACVELDDEPATLECTTFQPGESADHEVDELVHEIRAAIATERQLRAATTRMSLDEILDDQLVRGDLDAAAATYRELHAAYFSTLDDDRAIATAQAKVRDLVRLRAR